jgi:two-component system NtrC family response regulator
MSRKHSKEVRHLLVIEDDGYCHFFLSEVLMPQSVEVTVVRNNVKAFEITLKEDFDALMINLDALNQEELAPVRVIHEANNQVPIIAVSERVDVDFALEVLRAGAFDYLIKPFNNVARVEKAVSNAFSERDKIRQTTELSEAEQITMGLLGKSKSLKELHQMISQIAPLNVNVLITGESGTGKELIARAIHAASGRKPDSFFAVNCGALPEGLVESILFGHEKGAYTGADQSHVGYVERANGGTLLLDEVGELSPKAQVALLRFLQDHEFTRVGGVSKRNSDARIIASTNRNLEEAVAGNRFRSDLYYRLNVIHLKALPLRERPEDIMYLIDYFSKRFNVINQVPRRTFSTDAVRLLEEYTWPGNVRELENLVEGVMAMIPPGKEAINDKDLLSFSEGIRKYQATEQETAQDTVVELSHKGAMEEYERAYLHAVLEKHHGNVAKAARHAKIHPVTFHRKLKKFREPS